MMFVPFIDLSTEFKKNRWRFIRAFSKVGRSGNYILGPNVQEFEKEIASFCDTKYAISVANGSDALFLILKALNIGPGDEVITVPNSFIASAWVIEAVGAKIVFCDVDESMNISTKEFKQVITSRTKAVIAVHLTGIPCDIKQIVNISNKFGIHVIEDCAQSIGAEVSGKKVGSFGIAAGFSLHPLKNLGVLGDGGFITTSDSELNYKIRLLRNHGLENRDNALMWGYNSRLDEVQAAIALIKLKGLNKINSEIRLIAQMYTNGLHGLVTTPRVSDEKIPVFHNYIIRTNERDNLKSFLNKKGIETKIHYPIPLHLQKCSEHLNYKKGDFINSEEHSNFSLSLPIHTNLTKKQINYVIKSIKEFFAN